MQFFLSLISSTFVPVCKRPISKVKLVIERSVLRFKKFEILHLGESILDGATASISSGLSTPSHGIDRADNTPEIQTRESPAEVEWFEVQLPTPFNPTAVLEYKIWASECGSNELGDIKIETFDEDGCSNGKVTPKYVELSKKNLKTYGSKTSCVAKLRTTEDAVIERLRLNKNVAVDHLSLSEIRIINLMGENIALNATITAKSTHECCGTPDVLNDGRIYRGTDSENAQLYVSLSAAFEFIDIEFEEDVMLKDISRMEFYNLNDGNSLLNGAKVVAFAKNWQVIRNYEKLSYWDDSKHLAIWAYEGKLSSL